MTSIIPNNDNILSFKRYLLNESLAPMKTPYGVNESMDDYDYINDDSLPLVYSFFTDGKYYYCVFIYTDDGEVAFGTSDKASLNYHDYTVNRKGTGRGLYVFNKFMFIILTIANTLKLSNLRFEASDPELGMVYNRAVQNKFLLKAIEGYGWKYLDKQNDEYVFQKSTQS